MRYSEISRRAILLSLLLTIGIGAALLTPARGEAASSPPPEIIEVTATLPDSSLRMFGYLVLPPKLYTKVKPPLVVMLHQFGEDHQAWKKLWEAVYPSGIAVLALDMRGHGNSTFDVKRNQRRPPNTFYEGEFLKYPDDVKFFVDTCVAMYGDRVDASKIAVVGASIGANTGLLYALKEPRVEYLAMISPGLDYRGLELAPAMLKVDDLDIFIATADQDIYSYTSVDLLTDFFADKVDYEIYSAMHHGNRLLNTNVDLLRRIVHDLVVHLRPDIPLLD